jgi:hypothetical protein
MMIFLTLRNSSSIRMPCCPQAMMPPATLAARIPAPPVQLQRARYETLKILENIEICGEREWAYETT